MAISWTMSRYIGREFLKSVGIVMGGAMGLVFVIDMVEMVREHSDKAGLSVPLILGMSVLKMPNLSEKIFPFAVFFGAMWTFTRLSRSSELVVARAAGVSVWQFLAPAIATALAAGFVWIAIYNPVSAMLTARYASLEAKYIRGELSLLSVSKTGLWLRQPDQGGQLIVHALRVDEAALRLEDVIIFRLDEAGRFDSRIDATSAQLNEPYWEIEDALTTGRDRKPESVANTRLATTVTEEQIRESFASPDTLSFWDLPRFIAMAENAGFAALRHRLHWHLLLSSPFFLAAMVLIAASFSLRLARSGGMWQLALVGLLAGFFIFFVADLTAALGQSGVVPVQMAAWVPTIFAFALGGNLLLHAEDG
jgi:lipopolysaccharide export system permease protein